MNNMYQSHPNRLFKLYPKTKFKSNKQSLSATNLNDKSTNNSKNYYYVNQSSRTSYEFVPFNHQKGFSHKQRECQINKTFPRKVKTFRPWAQQNQSMQNSAFFRSNDIFRRKSKTLRLWTKQPQQGSKPKICQSAEIYRPNMQKISNGKKTLFITNLQQLRNSKQEIPRKLSSFQKSTLNRLRKRQEITLRKKFAGLRIDYQGFNQYHKLMNLMPKSLRLFNKQI